MKRYEVIERVFDNYHSLAVTPSGKLVLLYVMTGKRCFIHEDPSNFYDVDNPAEPKLYGEN